MLLDSGMVRIPTSFSVVSTAGAAVLLSVTESDKGNLAQSPTSNIFVCLYRAGVFANTEEGHAARVHELLGWMDANMFVLESETAAALARKDALISWFRHSLLTDPYFMFRPLFRIVISAEGSCNVLCASAEGIEADDIVMIGDFVNYKACTTDEIDRVSKIVVTTMQNVGLSDSFLFNDGENEVEDGFRAILILMHELCKGEASPIHAYLATWPRPDACADMPLYWTDADLNQLAGTLSQFMIQTAVKEVRDISEILKRELGGHLDFAGAGFDSLGALFKYVVCNFQSRCLFLSSESGLPIPPFLLHSPCTPPSPSFFPLYSPLFPSPAPSLLSFFPVFSGFPPLPPSPSILGVRY